MASRARSKGNYHENWFIKLFAAWKIKAKKQPLSGSLGGEYRGDLILTINGEDIITEVKYRKGTFPPHSLYWMDAMLLSTNVAMALIQSGS